MKLYELKIIKYFTLILFAFVISLVYIGLTKVSSSDSSYISRIQINEGISNTVLIGVSVVFLTSIISIYFAIINVYYDYKFKKLIHILTFLPMTIPCYILAYEYNILFSSGGELSFVKYNFDPVYKAIIFYTLAFFPYSYMMVRSTLKKIPYSLIENALVIDNNFLKVVFKIIIPLISKSVIAAGILILSEVFSDIGVVEYFNIPTISTIIKQTYVVNGNYRLAVEFGFKFALVMIILFIIESFLFPSITYTSKYSNVRERKLTPKVMLGYFSIFSIVLLLGFLIPVFFMIKWSITSFELFDFNIYLGALVNTVLLNGVVVVIIIVVGLCISHINKFNRVLRTLYTIFNIWYIMPSILISLLISIYFMNINNSFGTKFYSSTTIILLIIAYIIKYLPLATNTISKSYYQISNKLIDSALVMNKSRFSSFLNVDVAMLRKPIIASILIVVTDLVKELTLVYTLRPFNFETLSTVAASYAKDEMVQESSLYSLTIVIICFSIVLLLTKKEEKSDSSK